MLLNLDLDTKGSQLLQSNWEVSSSIHTPNLIKLSVCLTNQSSYELLNLENGPSVSNFDATELSF